MSLGTGAFKVGRGPEYFRPRQGRIHGNPLNGNHPCRQLPTANLHTEICKDSLKTCVNFFLMCSDQLESARIRLKQKQIDPQRSARIYKDSLKTCYLIGKDQLESAKCNLQYASDVEVPSS